MASRLVRLLSVFVGTLASCGGGSSAGHSPGGPTSLPQLSIVPSSLNMSVGETATLVAVDTGGGPSAVNWSSEKPEVITITPSGLAEAKSIGETSILASSGTLAARATGVVVRRIAGTWVGTTRMTGCTRQSGPGRNPCPTGIEFPLRMTLDQSGSSLSGELASFETVKGTVTASIDVNSTLVVAGTIPYEGGEVAVNTWNTTVTDSDMSGTYVLTQKFTNAFGPQVLKETFEIVKCSRQ